VKAKVRFTYPKNIRFVCSGCGLCCGDTPSKSRQVLLTKRDAERIAAHVKRPVNGFASETSGRAPYLFVMRKNPDTGMCIFLQDNRCTIYEHRPLICRFYPFELSTDENGIFVFKETNECPVIFDKDGVEARELDEQFFCELFKLACRELDRAPGQA
jgi:Fe-S-cluster containining protein